MSPLGTIGRIEALSNLGQIRAGAENLLGGAQMHDLAIRPGVNFVEPVRKQLDKPIADCVHRRPAQGKSGDGICDFECDHARTCRRAGAATRAFMSSRAMTTFCTSVAPS